MVKKIISKIIFGLIIFFPLLSFAQIPATPNPNPPCQSGSIPPCGAASQNASTSTAGQTSGFDLNIRIQNPLKAQTIQDAIKLFMGIILKLAIPVIIFFFLWTGFSYITALGNPTKVGKAHTMFLYTIIGTLLVLGAWAITNAIVGTINAIVTP